VASVIYDNWTKECNTGTDKVDWASDTIKVMLVTSSYTPNRATHQYKSDVTNEVTGTGYTAGGATLASKTETVDTTNHRTGYSAANVSWATATITARAAVVYKDTGTAGSSPLIAYIDFGSDQTSTAGTFQVTWNAAGIVTLTGS
jgi:hypothetical protein